MTAKMLIGSALALLFTGIIVGLLMARLHVKKLFHPYRRVVWQGRAFLVVPESDYLSLVNRTIRKQWNRQEQKQ
jgi:hypothetical protein